MGLRALKIFEVEDAKIYNHILYNHIEIFSEKMTFITGGSGTGKSTLLRLLNGTITPEEGSIYYKGKNLEKWDILELRKEVVLIGQQTYLFDDTIENNFILYSKYRKSLCPDRKLMRYYLDLCKADFPLDSHCKRLSGGERQRVYLAIFLSFQPKVLLLDEPTSALDEKTAYGLFENLKKLRTEDRSTMVVVSHDLQLREKFADDVIDLERKDS